MYVVTFLSCVSSLGSAYSFNSGYYRPVAFPLHKECNWTRQGAPFVSSGIPSREFDVKPSRKAEGG